MGGNGLRFDYTVQAGDAAASGITVGSTIDLNGGTLADIAGNAAPLALSGAGTLSGVKVSTAVLALASVTVDSADEKIHGPGSVIRLTANFGGAVTITGTPRLVLAVGSTSVEVDYSGSGTVFTYTVGSGPDDSDGDGILVTGIALNGGSIMDTTATPQSINTNVPTPLVVGSGGVVVDTTAPTFHAFTPPGDQTYGRGSVLAFEVTYNENIAVTGMPRLALTGFSDSTTRLAEFSQKVGGNGLRFDYTVQAGDTAASGITVASTIDLNGGTLADIAGNAAPLALSGAGALSGVKVSTETLALASVTVDSADEKVHGPGSVIQLTADFGGAVTITGVPRLVLEVGSTQVQVDYSGSGTVFTYTVSSGHNDSDGIRVTGIALNGGSIMDTTASPQNINTNVPTPLAVGSGGVKVDTTAPSLQAFTPPGDQAYGRVVCWRLS